MSNTTPVFTLAEGQPIPNPGISQTLPTFGGGGLVTLSDTLLLETLAHFNRERIPERVVHAKASGAWGEFEVTNDISHLTAAKFLTGVGKKTPVLFRLSTTGGEKGSADTVRDVRGFSVKFFTEEGNHDIVGNHVPAFFVRDPVLFPSLNRSHKKHPQTNRADDTMFWDFHVHHPESVHALMHLFGSRGVPANIRSVTGFGVHTYKLIAPDGSFKYCKFHFRPEHGVANMSETEAGRIAGDNPDFHNQDLFEAIAQKRYPVWTLAIQVMEPERAETYGRKTFDITKVWPHGQFPLIPVGKMTLNKNPDNYFAEIEQAAFSPSNMVPGIAASPDPMLQARMFAYPDAQRYRLGVNYPSLLPNRPLIPSYTPYLRDGSFTFPSASTSAPNYVGSIFPSGIASPSAREVRHEEWIRGSGVLGLNRLEVSEEDYEQPRELWRRVFDEGERRAWAGNVARAVEGVPEGLRARVVEMFGKVDTEIARMIRENLK